MNPKLFFILAGAVIAILLIGEWQKLQPAPPPAPAAPARSSAATELIDACLVAEKAVRATLKAPASAKFPSCGWSAHEYEVRRTPDGSITWVLGHVDSQNSFGAMIRSNFVAKLDSTSRPMRPIEITVE